jgi:MSHA biogenesis protein MshL
MRKITDRPLAYWLALTLALPLAGCSFLDLRPDRGAPGEFREALEDAKKAPDKTGPKRFQPPPPAVADALLPDLGPPGLARKPASRERRFDISVMGADAREFFMGLVADSDHNVIVHPDVRGTIAIDLKNVTLPEVLDAVREVYGYDYKKTQAGYVIYPAELMSRLYHLDYINFVRSGRSETRVSTGANAQSPFFAGGGVGGWAGQNFLGGGMQGQPGTGMGSTGAAGGTGATGEADEVVDCRDFQVTEGGQGSERTGNRTGIPLSRGVPSMPGSVIATTSVSHFWRELKQALGVIVCGAPGANFVVNQQSGVVVVKAFPKQLREVEQFLEAIRRETQRQVVLEAKILEVSLKDGYQAGIDWASLIRTGEQAMLTSLAGPIGGAAALQTLGQAFTVGVNMGDFSAFVELLETQGNVNTLSSPRISTLNNQKAVIKVGADSLHVSNVNPGSFAAGTIGGAGFAPSPVLSPFFSGIALDVTPQIDDSGRVTLHIHPSVTEVEDRVTRLDFGAGQQEIPLAFSSVRESDSVVHARSGQIVVIGGLMQNQEKNTREGVAWFSRIPVLGSLFRRGKGDFRKSELVILLKPTLIDEPGDWDGVRGEIRERYQRLDGESRQEVLP